MTTLFSPLPVPRMNDPLKALSAGGCESPCQYLISVVNPLGMKLYRSTDPISWSPIRDESTVLFPSFGMAMDAKLKMMELGFALNLSYYATLRIEEITNA